MFAGEVLFVGELPGFAGPVLGVDFVGWGVLGGVVVEVFYDGEVGVGEFLEGGEFGFWGGG